MMVNRIHSFIKLMLNKNSIFNWTWNDLCFDSYL